MNYEGTQIWKIFGTYLHHYLTETDKYLGFGFIVC